MCNVVVTVTYTVSWNSNHGAHAALFALLCLTAEHVAKNAE